MGRRNVGLWLAVVVGAGVGLYVSMLWCPLGAACAQLPAEAWPQVDDGGPFLLRVLSLILSLGLVASLLLLAYQVGLDEAPKE